jgi:hypothetical protein
MVSGDVSDPSKNAATPFATGRITIASRFAAASL